MKINSRGVSFDIWILVCVSVLVFLSLIVLNSISPAIFPQYYLFVVVGFLAFFFFTKIDFDILYAFSGHFYVLSMILLILPLLIGQLTRGTIRWIPLGSVAIQPSELVRPFLILHFARIMTTKKMKRNDYIKTAILMLLPIILIFIQPSLGVAILTFIGFVGVILSTGIDKKYLAGSLLIGIVSIPVMWFFLAPYQRERITTFIDPFRDPTGAGYNSIQSMIAVGSGKIFGRGLGEGVQTQLAFLPARHTDFVFAAIAEELGIIGAFVLCIALIVLFLRLIDSIECAKNFTSRAFISGVFLVTFAETMIHLGMNVGLMPITGVPLPLVSAGGSSFLATMISLGMVMRARKNIGLS